MKKLSALLVTLSLAGCATMQAPDLAAKPVPVLHKVHPHVVKKAPPPVVVPAAPPAPPAAPTFKDRWQTFKHKHPLKWFHH